ncbi:MAG: hypothetical protein AB7L09_24695 [Nitrospira sp.]
MRITQITLNFTETCNLGDYSNTKPSIELTALLDAGDDVQVVIDELVTRAKSVIHDKIDEELEKVDRAPKYWKGDRYDVIYSLRTNMVAIVPQASISQLDGGFYSAADGVRYEAARGRAKGRARDNRDVRVFDCADGDLTELIAYTTERNQAYEQAQVERRQREAEESRQRQAEWDAQRQMPEVEEDEEEEDEE